MLHPRFQTFTPARCRILWSFTLTGGILSGSSVAEDAPQISAWLVDGRQIQGELDGSTNSKTLRLINRTPNASLQSNFPFDAIRFIERDGHPIETQAFRRDLLRDHKQHRLRTKFEVNMTSRRFCRVSERCSATTSGDVSARVTHLHVEAELASWNDDGDADGMLVTVAPLDAAGQLVAIRGNLELTLLRNSNESLHTSGRKSALTEELARASHLVRPTDFSNGLAQYRLPFKYVDAWNKNGPLTGIVHARLGIDGQGAFTNSSRDVRLQTYSAVRDRLQQRTGDRYFPEER